MTAIAVRDGVIAADSGRWHNDMCFGTCKKIFEIHGSLLGACGSERAIFALVNWLLSGDYPDNIPSNEILGEDGLTAFLLLDSVGVRRFDGFFDTPEPAPFVAGGPHAEFLRGAMAAGASAEEAVRLAVEHCAFARGPVQVRRVGG